MLEFVIIRKTNGFRRACIYVCKNINGSLSGCHIAKETKINSLLYDLKHE